MMQTWAQGTPIRTGLWLNVISLGTDVMWCECPHGQGLSHRDKDPIQTVPGTKSLVWDGQATVPYCPLTEPCKVAVCWLGTLRCKMEPAVTNHTAEGTVWSFLVALSLSLKFMAAVTVLCCVPDQEVINRPENWERKSAYRKYLGLHLICSVLGFKMTEQNRKPAGIFKCDSEIKHDSFLSQNTSHSNPRLRCCWCASDIVL